MGASDLALMGRLAPFGRGRFGVDRLVTLRVRSVTIAHRNVGSCQTYLMADREQRNPTRGRGARTLRLGPGGPPWAGGVVGARAFRGGFLGQPTAPVGEPVAGGGEA